MKHDYKRLGICLAVPLAVGGLAAYLMRDNTIMFELVKKPPLAPPPWLFPVAWTLLYILMGAASYRVWRSRAPLGRRRLAAVYYAMSLAFNFGWPILFFNLDKYLAAFVWLCLLWLFTLLSTAWFYRCDKPAGAMMLPYVLWVAFAGYLNLGVYLLN